MKIPKHFNILVQGMKDWNKWRMDNKEVLPELSGANLHEFDLRNFNLSKADLTEANLEFADLTNVDLSEANLFKAYLYMSDLSDSCLNGAYLHKAFFFETNLKNTNFKRATLSECTFCAVDLSVASELENVQHYGRIHIDINTIYKSKGNIPESFLRGAGLQENFIQYIPSLVNQPIQFYSCFISYSSQDQGFAERLHADLQRKGVRCWFAPEDMKSGKKIYHQLDDAIKYHDKLLLVLSEHSLKSDWVKNEIKWARKREKETNKQKLFPIALVPYEELKVWDLFDSDTATDLAAEIRSYYIPDFTRWKYHDEYQKAFDRLLRDLKAEG